METKVCDDIHMIDSLPNEIISLILMNVDCRDVINFGITCKRFNDLVNTDQTLWKYHFKNKLPTNIVDIVQQSQGDWLDEIRRYYTVRNQVYAEIQSMTSKYYSIIIDISLEDVRELFALAVSHSLSYYYTVTTLQEIVRRCHKNLQKLVGEKPYTLTEMYYAKVALRHLIQTFQALKWVKLHVNEQLPPVVVINFFVQWIDTDNLYCDKEIENRVDNLVQRVEQLLETTHPVKSKETIKQRKDKGLIKEVQILTAISEVLYHQPHMAVTSAASVDTLSVPKLLDVKCGNAIAVGALYDAVAKRFGVNCDLIAFPNHLFLEWRDHPDNRLAKIYTIDIGTGNIQPKRQCPFSQRDPTKRYKYYPDSLLQYIYSAFHVTMGALTNWQTKNALHLLDFLGTDDNLYNPYRNFLPYLLDQTHMPGNISINHLSSTHLSIISTLANWNPPLQHERRERVVKRHEASVRYAVGMICYHRRHDFICIVRSWATGVTPDNELSADNSQLEFGLNQAFYVVIAADQSERYVAQENLSHINKPSRIYHLEDKLAREFSHFDGFAYVPNEGKRQEYPDDSLIVDNYRNRCLI